MTAATPDTAGRASPAATRWRARAFGMELEAGFEVVGLPPAAGTADRRSTRLTLVPPDELAAGWPRREARRIEQARTAAGRLLLTVDHHPDAGYRWAASGYGRYVVSSDGHEVRIAPYSVSSWRWQRMLIARVLPFAATLQGLEVFHASAVEIDGRVVAFVAQTGVGKTSLAVNLVLRGATFVTDDVLAIEPRAGDLRAHPGLALVSIRPEERRRISAAMRGLGTVVSRGSKTHVELTRRNDPGPLDTMLFVRRRSDFAELAMRKVDPVDPQRLLAYTFNTIVREPARLVRQLDVCAEIAARARVLDVEVPMSVDPDAVAEAVLDRVRATAAP